MSDLATCRAAGAGRGAARVAGGPVRRRRRRLLGPRALERARLRRQLRGRGLRRRPSNAPTLWRARASGAQHPAQGRRGRAGARGPGGAVPRRPRRADRRRPRASPRCVRERYPGLPLHASTQLNTHSSAQLAALARLGFSRAILARELSLDEIAALDAHGLELEAFVHGALCYGYSGDCLLVEHDRRPQRQPRSLQPVVPPAVHRWPGRRRTPAGRGPATGTPDAAAASCRPPTWRPSTPAGDGRRRRRSLQDRGPHEGRRLRRRDDGRLSRGAGRGARRSRGLRGTARVAPSLEQSFSRGFTTAHLEGRHAEVRSGGRGGHRGVLGRARAERRRGAGPGDRAALAAGGGGDVVQFYTPWGRPSRCASSEGGDDAAGPARARARRRQGPPLPPLRGGRRRLGHDLASGRLALRPVRLHLRLDGRAGSRHTHGHAGARDAEPLGGGSHRRASGAGPHCPPHRGQGARGAGGVRRHAV